MAPYETPIISLSPLLDARSIAVVGASNKPGSFGGQVVRNLVEFSYPGSVYGVHPRLTTLYDRPCFPSLSALPERPDCIALAVANKHLLPLLEEAASLNIPSAVVFGDPNVGTDRDPNLQSRIGKLARHNGITVCDPNSMGIYCLHRKLVISGYPVRPDKPAGNIALVTHSGTVFDAMSQNNRDVHFNYVISGGNEATVTAADYMRFVLDDPTTRVVACYLETVRDPEGFIAALRLANERQVPVVALKVGLSERGRALAQAHSGALAGGPEAYAALFQRYGVCQVRSLDEMMDTLELFSRIQKVPNPDVTVLMESGGERSLFVDLAVDRGVPLTNLSADTVKRLEDILEPGVIPDNPLDAFGTGSDVVGTYRNCLLAQNDDPNTGLLLLAVDLARDSYLSPDYVEAAIGAVDQLKKPFACMVNLTSGAGDEFVVQLRKQGVPVLMGTETGLRAIRHLIDFSDFMDRPSFDPEFIGRPAADVVERLRVQLRQANAPLDEHASTTMLAAYGLPIAREYVVESSDQAVEAASSMRCPVALKTLAPGILHKTDTGGVFLGLEDKAEIQRAYESLVRQFGPQVLVQEMVTGGIECILGMSTDLQFGPILLLGLGGVFVEIFRDVQTCLPPLSQFDAECLYDQLKGGALLKGHRGKPAADLAALTDTILRFSTFVTDLGDLISQIDINPISVLPSGAVILDALIVPLDIK
ncbi:MAG: hypothetical protein GQ528_07140 [Woeseiaceae bacterium]|nr:hypothetical protein [Woeseiaceae bacterium]